MAVTLEQDEDRNLIRFAETVDIACAAELKQLLVQALVSGKEICVDAEQAGGMDVTAIQSALGGAARSGGGRRGIRSDCSCSG